MSFSKHLDIHCLSRNALLFVTLRCLGPKAKINKWEGKSENQNHVTCSYFHCKMEHILILALSFITLSCKFGMNKVLSLRNIALQCRSSLMSLYWILLEYTWNVIGIFQFCYFISLDCEPLMISGNLFYKSLFLRLCSSICYIPGTLCVLL